MSLKRKIKNRISRRALRVRKNIRISQLPRISVFRSLNHIYAQVIDNQKQATLASYSSLQLKKAKGNKKEISYAVGIELAKAAADLGIVKAIFDRGPYLYHGRVASLVQGLREGGMEI